MMARNKATAVILTDSSSSNGREKIMTGHQTNSSRMSVRGYYSPII